MKYKNKIFGSLNQEKKAAYVVNHKAACTSIVTALYKHEFSARDWYPFKKKNFDYIFTFVRNPYDRLVSRFAHLHEIIAKINKKEIKIGDSPAEDHNILSFYGKKPIDPTKFSFRAFVNFTLRIHDAHWESQVYKFEAQLGNIKDLNFIGKFENFQADFDIVCEKIGIPRQKLPHLYKSKHKHYTEYYNDKTREIVAQRYARDIEYFGYKFGE